MVGFTEPDENQRASGGERESSNRQALVKYPKMIIADEPTGNIDPAAVLRSGCLEKINELGTTVLVVTHEKELVDRFTKRVIVIDGGRIISDGMGGYYTYEEE